MASHSALRIIKSPRVLLAGTGEWGTKSYLKPVLLPLHTEGTIRLGILDRAPMSPDIEQLLAGKGVQYFRDLSEAGDWDMVVVVVPAKAQREVCRDLLGRLPSLQTMLVEKPFGSNIDDATSICKAAAAQGVRLLMADHYLLRPGLLRFLEERERFFDAMGHVLSIRLCLTEAGAAGPPGSSVGVDLLPHVISLANAIFPQKEFSIDLASFRLASEKFDGWQDSACDAIGSVGDIPVTIQVGKLLEDRKEIAIYGEDGWVRINLVTNFVHVCSFSLAGVFKPCNLQWTYERLIRDLVRSLKAPSAPMLL